MNCPKCDTRMQGEYCPYAPGLPYWTYATLYRCPACERYWLHVENTEQVAIDAALGKDVIPHGLYLWNGADTLPNLLKRKDELWDKRAKIQLEGQ